MLRVFVRDYYDFISNGSHGEADNKSDSLYTKGHP